MLQHLEKRVPVQANYKHPLGTTLPTLSTQPAQERAASAVANQHTSELAELKAMILTLVKEGA